MARISAYHLSFVLVIFLFCCSCHQGRNKKNTNQTLVSDKNSGHYLYLSEGTPITIVRVECTDCAVEYRVNRKSVIRNIKDGNLEMGVKLHKKNKLRVILKAKTDQYIRSVVIDPNGQVIFNKLEKYNKNKTYERQFISGYKMEKGTILKNSRIYDIIN